MTQLKSVELFSGAGGLALGLHRAGFRHDALYEWNAAAVETLQYNKAMGYPAFKGCAVTRADVREIDFTKHRGVDLVAGGPPCQPFSMGGKARGANDIRDMFPQAIRAVAEIQPRAFLFENVRGLLRPAFSNYVEYIRLQLEFPSFPISQNANWDVNLARLQRHKEERGSNGTSLRYRVHVHQANAADYGVPQQRHRVFFVGFRSDVTSDWFFPTATHSKINLGICQREDGPFWSDTGLDMTAHIPVITAKNATAETGKQRWQCLYEAIRDLPEPTEKPCPGIGNHILQTGAKAYPGHTGSPLHLPSKALKAGDHGVPGGENMIAYPDGTVRYLTVRESARVQTFPDDYAFLGSWTETMRQLGNAVPVRLAEVVAKSVAKTLMEDSAIQKNAEPAHTNC
jgi:DNA (cytosine-5)-methyltransferase 1